ncbi:flagellar basal body P-ring formation chaperone FlgA [Marinobacter salicampi]|uniref:flagellar basal body P-ring formation chaperone FlgA n=1 Tax=Marinobacter salicampi TaxID=435907 RepID=UPI0014098A95|nr:flagellar basal body P-ring formation chaperone FlgA [Marinobacter salicampi]
MRTYLALTLMLCTSALVDAGPTTAPASILSAAESFLADFKQEQAAAGYQVSYQLGSLDSRLQLAPCEGEPTVEFSGDPWRSTHPRLQVACEGDRPWKLYLTSSLTIEGDALVAARPLNRGNRLDDSMITTAKVVINSIRRGAVTEEAHLLGMEMKRPVNAGTVFTPYLITAPDAVARGDHVMITATNGSFSVRSRGKALANGSVGDQVPIENLTSSRTIKGIVTGPGQVLIPM